MAVIEYFYAAHSGYAYIGSKLLSEVAAAAGARIDQRANAATPSVFLRP